MNELTTMYGMNELSKLMDGDIDYITTLDPVDKEQRKKLLVLSQNEPDKKVSDYIGKQITFSHVYIEKVTIEDDIKKGKYIDAPRTVIETPEGTVTATSEGFAKSIMMILNCLGKPEEWDEEYWFEVKQVETRHNRRYFKLQFIE